MRGWSYLGSNNDINVRYQKEADSYSKLKHDSYITIVLSDKIYIELRCKYLSKYRRDEFGVTPRPEY